MLIRDLDPDTQLQPMIPRLIPQQLSQNAVADTVAPPQQQNVGDINTPPPAYEQWIAPATAAPLPTIRPQAPTVPTYQLSPIRQRRESGLENSLYNMQQKKPVKGFWGNAGRILSGIGNAAGEVILGDRNMQDIPGTNSYKMATIRNTGNELSGMQQQDLAEEQGVRQADIAQKQATAAGLIEITPEMAKELGEPTLEGQQVTQGALQHLYTTASTNKTKADTTHETNETRLEMDQVNNLTKEKMTSLKPEQRDDRAIALWQKQQEGHPLTQEETSYLAAYSQWIDQTKIQPGVERAKAFNAFRPLQTVDEFNNVHYTQAGQAEAGNMNAPGSLPFRTALSVAKAFTSGPSSHHADSISHGD